MEFPLLLICILIAVVLLLQLVLLIKQKNAAHSSQKIDALAESLQRLERNLREDFQINREESAKQSKVNRDEQNQSLKEFRFEMSEILKNLAQQNQTALEKLTLTMEQKLGLLMDQSANQAKDHREELSKNLQAFSEANQVHLTRINQQIERQMNASNEHIQKEGQLHREALAAGLKDFQQAFDKNVLAFNELQREKFASMESKQNELVKSTELKLDVIRATVEEKLEKTLSERLGQSFETVGKQLLEVQKGLGEMHTLAQDVGGLKKVLSNVKMRGGLGEVQLEMLLEQLLAPDQFEANVKTKKNSNDLVEFAIKLPGRDEQTGAVYLPIDAKFPKDAYDLLVDAYESADVVRIDAANKNLENTVKKMAKDIRDKYLDPPHTTDFGILFLPFEGIYAEVVRRSSLLEQLQREFKVLITGPSTLAAILNSLQMGFRTLALQKRSSEVWNILGSVKNEFEKFGGLLEKAQKNISTASGAIDELLGTRTNAINRKLKDVQWISKGVEPQDSFNAITSLPLSEDHNGELKN